MSRECGCLGGNENCTACHGLGYLPDPFAGDSRDSSFTGVVSVPEMRYTKHGTASDVARLTHQHLQDPPVQPARSTFGCLYCKAYFYADDQRELHVCAEHVADIDDHSENALSKPIVRKDGRLYERRYLGRIKAQAKTGSGKPKSLDARDAQVKLPSVKDAAVNQAGLVPGKVNSMSHPKGNALAVPAGVVVGTGGSKQPLVLCPKCKGGVRQDRLERHLRKIHRAGCKSYATTITKPTHGVNGDRSERSRGRQQHKAPVAVGRTPLKRDTGTDLQFVPTQAYSLADVKDDKNDELMSEMEEYREERRLDGSRDYWQFREDGQFGSHPSYDDLDDESEP